MAGNVWVAFMEEEGVLEGLVSLSTGEMGDLVVVDVERVDNLEENEEVDFDVDENF